MNNILPSKQPNNLNLGINYGSIKQPNKPNVSNSTPEFLKTENNPNKHLLNVTSSDNDSVTQKVPRHVEEALMDGLDRLVKPESVKKISENVTVFNIEVKKDTSSEDAVRDLDKHVSDDYVVDVNQLKDKDGKAVYQVILVKTDEHGKKLSDSKLQDEDEAMSKFAKDNPDFFHKLVVDTFKDQRNNALRNHIFKAQQSMYQPGYKLGEIIYVPPDTGKDKEGFYTHTIEYGDRSVDLKSRSPYLSAEDIMPLAFDSKQTGQKVYYVDK